MWSKRIGGSAKTYYTPPWTGGRSPAVKWDNQYEYDEWLLGKRKLGDVLCYNGNKDVRDQAYVTVLVITAIQLDYLDMHFDTVTGQPKYMEVTSFYPSMSQPYPRWDDGVAYRPLRDEELKWVEQDAKLQDSFQRHIPNIKINYTSGL